MKTKEYREKMSQAVKGEKNGMYGRHHTEETKILMSKKSVDKTLGEKNGKKRKKGDKAINGKKIHMYDESHNLIRIFNAKTAALEFLGLTGHTGLANAIKNNTIYKGYYWSVETK